KKRAVMQKSSGVQVLLLYIQWHRKRRWRRPWAHGIPARSSVSIFFARPSAHAASLTKAALTQKSHCQKLSIRPNGHLKKSLTAIAVIAPASFAGNFVAPGEGGLFFEVPIFQAIIYVFQEFVLEGEQSLLRFPPVPTSIAPGFDRWDLDADGHTEKLV